MHAWRDWMFNQVGDDRYHQVMRLPKEDPFYGKGLEGPVYLSTGKPQGLRKYKNRTTGVASTAGKFRTAFALGHQLLAARDNPFAKQLHDPAFSAYELGLKSPGGCQTASCVSPCFFEGDNRVDDLHLRG